MHRNGKSDETTIALRGDDQLCKSFCHLFARRNAQIGTEDAG